MSEPILGTAHTDGETKPVSVDNALCGFHDDWIINDVLATRRALPTDFERVVDATRFGLDPSALAATNTNALQTADGVAFLLGLHIYVPAGTYQVDVVTHPNGGLSPSKCVLALHSGVHLYGAGADKTVLKLKSAASLSAGSNPPLNRFITNWNPAGTGTYDTDIVISDLTIDGNAANNGTATKCMHGVQLWNVRRSYYRNLVVLNCRGDDTATNETFHLDFVRSQEVGIENCVVATEDGGVTASGISMNFTDDFQVKGCKAYGMDVGQGFTFYSSGNGRTSDCYAGGNGAGGFNEEHCTNVTYTNCIAGAENARIDSATASVTFTGGAANANDKGFVFLHTHGGGNIVLENCISRGNTTRNVGITGAVAGTAATGTTSSTVVATTSMFFQPMVDNYIQLGTGAWCKITAVSGSGASTTVTTSPAHGGSPADTITVQSGPVTWKSGQISKSAIGVQFTNTTTALKRLDARALNLTGVDIVDNTVDIQDCGNGSSTQLVRASGVIPAAVLDAFTPGTEFYTGLPFDVPVRIASGGTVSFRGSHPRCSLTSLGVASVSEVISHGCSISVATSGTLVGVLP
jgi:hypothetical protein